MNLINSVVLVVDGVMLHSKFHIESYHKLSNLTKT